MPHVTQAIAGGHELPAIREDWSGILAMNGRSAPQSIAIAAGDLAQVSNEWAFEVGGEQISPVTSEVARHQDEARGGRIDVIGQAICRKVSLHSIRSK